MGVGVRGGAIQRLRSGKAAGVDDKLAEMLKAAEHEIMPFFTRNFTVLFSSQFPLEWSKAIIIPLHQKGEMHTTQIITDDYHPRAL